MGSPPPAPPAPPPEALLTVPTTRWRVKLYRLDDGVWNDHGTGFCWGEVRGHGGSEHQAHLVVDDETEPNTRILDCTIQGSATYQKQDTLIIWTEPTEDADLALSFQEAAGCVIVCEFLLYVHKLLEPDIRISVTVGQSDATETITDTIVLPYLPSRSNLEDVIQAIERASESQYGRDSLVVFFEHRGFLMHMGQVFTDVEGDATLDPTDRLRILYQLSRLVKTIFALGEGLLIDHMLEEEYFGSILGMLEYDPSFGTRKANYREFYERQTQFREVVRIRDSLVLEKIRRTFRLQLLKDVVLTRNLDDSTFSLVSTLIYVNQMEIVMALQTSPEFSAALFGLFTDATNEYDTRKKETTRPDGLRFIYNVMTTSKGFPAQQRLQLYLKMAEGGLMDALEWGLKASDVELRGAALESLNCVLELEPSIVRPGGWRIVLSLSQLLGETRNGAQRIQVCETIKLLLQDAAAHGDPSFDRDSGSDDDREKNQQTQDSQRPEIKNGTVSSFRYCVRMLFEKSPRFDDELVVDLLAFCFVTSPVVTSELVEELGLWAQVSERLQSCGVTPTSRPRAGLLLALVRCIRWSLRRPGDSLPFGGSLLQQHQQRQARLLVDSGVFSFAVNMLVNLGNVNTAVHSSLLGLARLVATEPGPQFAILREVLRKPAAGVSYIPFMRSLASGGEEDYDERTLKRPMDDDGEERRRSQRLRLSSGSPMLGDSSPVLGGSPTAHTGRVDEIEQMEEEQHQMERLGTPPPPSTTRSTTKPSTPPNIRRPGSAPPPYSPTTNGSGTPTPNTALNSTPTGANGSPSSHESSGGTRYSLKNTLAKTKRRLFPKRRTRTESAPEIGDRVLDHKEGQTR